MGNVSANPKKSTDLLRVVVYRKNGYLYVIFGESHQISGTNNYKNSLDFTELNKKYKSIYTCIIMRFYF
jgi:hypothetical protein